MEEAIAEANKPELVAVVPMDIHCLVRLRASDLRKVRSAMNMCTHTKEIEHMSLEERTAWEYFAGEFYKFIESTVKELDRAD